jgi:hypothetical protein
MRKKKVLICEHRARPVEQQPAVYARGLCRKCYDRARWSSMPETAATLRGAIDVPLAKALKNVPKAKKVPFRVANPKVANLIASAAIKNALDLPAAVSELKPDLTPSQVANVAEELEHSPLVQAAIQQGLQKRGLDQKSRERFVEILWQYAEDSDPANERRTLAAWRILGRGFISEKIEQTMIEPLRIEGFEEGIKRMLSEAPDPNAPDGSFTA